MRFLLLNNGLVTEKAGFSGSDRRVYELAKVLAHQGHDISVVVPKIGKPRFAGIGKNINIVLTAAFGDRRKSFYLLTYAWRAFRAYLVSARLIRQAEIIYSSSDLIADSLPAIYMKLSNRRLKLICGLHLLAPNPFKGFSFQNKSFLHPPSLANVYYFLSQRAIIFILKRLADLILVSNILDQQFLLKKGFRDNQVLVTPGAPDWDDINAAEKRKDLSYDACFLGRNHPQKGINDLLKSWQIVCRKRSNLRLAMLGELADLKDTVKQMGLADNVDFLGFVNGREKYSILKSCKISIFPSHYESFGIVACEAMACGLPVVAYDLPIYEQIYKGGMLKLPIGDYQALASSIEKLLGDDSYRTKLSQEALSSVQEFNWSKTCSIILEHLERE